jgi:radical SAM family uncharacterized protein
MTRPTGRVPPRILAQAAGRLLSHEQGTIRKPREHKTTVALVYPNSYYVAMSNLGFQSIYRLINSIPEALCERAFLPEPEEQQELRRARHPLFSLESFHPLRDFDLVAFSLSFENDYPAVLTVLEHAAIPLLRERRNDTYPLIIAGGVCACLNPEPLADFIDLFIIGEGEEVLPRLIAAYRDHREQGTARGALLAALAQIEGIYVPALYEVRYHPSGTIASFAPRENAPPRVRRAVAASLDRYPAHSTVITPFTEFSSMVLMEVSRGCPYGCNFCCLGSAYRPVRRRSLESLTAAAALAIKANAKIGLIGATLSDHPDLIPLCRFILEQGGTFSVTSLRIDLVNEDFIQLLKQSGHQTITLAPETGSERLRRVIHKNLSDEQIFQTVEIIAAYRFRHIKLYFLIGLPGETAFDIDCISDLTRRIQHHLIKANPRSRHPESITLSINAFIPKPGTPFQWHPFEEIATLQAKLKGIKNSLKNEKKITVTWDLPKWSYLQCLLSRGDRRVGKILMAAHEMGGSFLKAYRQVDVNPDFYVYRQRSLDELLPWDFIDHGVSKESLVEAYTQSLSHAAEL